MENALDPDAALKAERDAKLKARVEAAIGEKKQPDMERYLIAFRDGSYKKVRAVDWKHSQWIHLTLADGTVVRVNPDNVNYMHQGLAD